LAELDATMDRRSENEARMVTQAPCPPADGDRRSSVYLTLLIGIVGLFVVAASLCLGLQDSDHFTAIGRPGDVSWYQNLAGNYVSEIQDQDLFFHGIGRSIDYARRADVIILGSSLVSFALNEDVIRERLEKRYGLKFYNMAFVGVASGEFSRRIIEKFNLHPRLWIINADDGGGGGNFFGRNLTRAFGADVKEIPATHYGRMRARYEIMRRNLRWRFEAYGAVKRLVPPKAGVIPMFYRSDETGAADMSVFPHLLETGNPGVKMTRDPDCHTTPEVIANARDFVHALGAPAILTLVPNMHGCLTQVREVAQAVGLEVALSERTDYSAWDGGGHLDRSGSIAFTNDLVTALEKSSVFQALRQNDARRR
jgi:hypothetical protein